MLYCIDDRMYTVRKNLQLSNDKTYTNPKVHNLLCFGRFVETKSNRTSDERFRRLDSYHAAVLVIFIDI